MYRITNPCNIFINIVLLLEQVSYILLLNKLPFCFPVEKKTIEAN